MRHINLRLLLAIFLCAGMQFCSQSSSARTSQDLSSIDSLSSRSRSGSIVSKLRQEIEKMDLKTQIAEQAAAVAHKKNYDAVVLKKQQDRKKRHSFMEPLPK